MVDRLAAVEGNTTITSTNGMGTTVTLTLPITPLTGNGKGGSKDRKRRWLQPDKATK
jgi:hypothetical protein